MHKRATRAAMVLPAATDGTRSSPMKSGLEVRLVVDEFIHTQLSRFFGSSPERGLQYYYNCFFNPFQYLKEIKNL